jgi:hypothetical protein
LSFAFAAFSAGFASTIGFLELNGWYDFSSLLDILKADELEIVSIQRIKIHIINFYY